MHVKPTKTTIRPASHDNADLTAEAEVYSGVLALHPKP